MTRLTPFVLTLLLVAPRSIAQAQTPVANQGGATTPAAQVNQPTAPRAVEQGPIGVTPPSTPTTSGALPNAPVAPPAQQAVRTATAATAECPTCSDSVNAYWVAFGVITRFLAVALLAVFASLKNSDWSLAGALAEKSPELRTVKTMSSSTPNQPTAVTTVEEPALVGSASRVIAAVGSLVLTAVLLGVGYSMIWSLFTRGQIPALEGIGPYLMGGAALFAPYAFNQLKDAFKPAPKL